MQGKIVKIVSSDFTIQADKLYILKARGKFRNQKITPIVGDIVDFDEKRNLIIDILPRKNELKRPPVANVSQVLIVVSLKDPDLDLYLLDKLLCIIEFNNIKPIICFTKKDLLKENVDDIYNYYKKIGYDVYYNDELEKIKQIFKDKITVLAGQSGAGKSTLLNLLTPSLNLKTNEISKALGRGKHTTRHVELYPLFEGLIADTPGFSSLEFYDMSKSDIRDNMIEFNTYRHDCLYKDCMHQKEEDCEIKRQLNKNILKSRYENYLKFIERNNL